MPVESERVIKQVALNCAEKYFDEEKQRLHTLTAMTAEFSISSRVKKANTIVAESRRACVTRGARVSVSREELGI